MITNEQRDELLRLITIAELEHFQNGWNAAFPGDMAQEQGDKRTELRRYIREEL